MQDKDKKLVSESPEVEVSEEKTTPEIAIENEKDESDLLPQEEELRDQLLRALADNENIRRRAKKDVQEASQFAITNFARDLLSVADNMNRALTSIPSEALEENEALVAIVNGVEMTSAHGHATTNKINASYKYFIPISLPQNHGMLPSKIALANITGV